MWKNILALAALVLAAAFFVRSIPFAQAEIGPAVDMGSNPRVSFSGELALSTNQEPQLLTVPSGKDLIITGASFESQYCDLLINSTLLVDGYLISPNHSSSPTPIKVGHASIVVPSGSILSVGTEGSSNGSNCYGPYFVHGYYVRS